jgi:hypothetical protein
MHPTISQAEADLKEQAERLNMELTAEKEKLARTTRWLEGARAPPATEGRGAAAAGARENPVRPALGAGAPTRAAALLLPPGVHTPPVRRLPRPPRFALPNTPPHPAPPHPTPPHPAPPRPNPTQPNPTQPNPTQPNPPQPNPTHPNPTQPNPTQPNPEEKARADALVQRMGALIACLDPSGAHRAAEAASGSGTLPTVAGDLGERAAALLGLPPLREVPGPPAAAPPLGSQDSGNLASWPNSGPLPELGPGGPPDRSGGSGRSSSSFVDQIEAVRRELSKASVVVGSDSITCCELLVRGRPPGRGGAGRRWLAAAASPQQLPQGRGAPVVPNASAAHLTC